MDLSVVIPARNEEFLGLTIEGVLENAKAKTEVIAILDGYWPDEPLPQHDRLQVIHFEEPVGQRAGTNYGCALSTAKYIMKLDAHCKVDIAFDVKLMKKCEPDWTVVPRMYNLHAFDWECPKCGWRTYQSPKPKVCEQCRNKVFQKHMVWKRRKNRRSDFMRFDTNMKFAYWRAFGKRPEAQGKIAPQMSAIGACWFMEHKRWDYLEGLDENHGSWGQVGTEIACKSWLSGGKQVVNKKTWFAHMFRTGKGFGFPYKLSGRQVNNARRYSNDIWKNNKWHKQKYPLEWMIEKFKPIPDWHD